MTQITGTSSFDERSVKQYYIGRKTTGRFFFFFFSEYDRRVLDKSIFIRLTDITVPCAVMNQRLDCLSTRSVRSVYVCSNIAIAESLYTPDAFATPSLDGDERIFITRACPSRRADTYGHFAVSFVAAVVNFPIRSRLGDSSRSGQRA